MTIIFKYENLTLIIVSQSLGQNISKPPSPPNQKTSVCSPSAWSAFFWDFSEECDSESTLALSLGLWLSRLTLSLNHKSIAPAAFHCLKGGPSTAMCTSSSTWTWLISAVKIHAPIDHYSQVRKTVIQRLLLCIDWIENFPPNNLVVLSNYIQITSRVVDHVIPLILNCRKINACCFQWYLKLFTDAA